MNITRSIATLALTAMTIMPGAGSLFATAEDLPATIRIATYNTSLYGKKAGEVRDRLATGTFRQAEKIASIVQTVRPDILLLNEIDHDADGETVTLMAEKYLAVGQDDLRPIDYPFRYSAPSNTGIRSGMDLDSDGSTSGPADAFGFGLYPGQYSMAVLSRFPIDADNIRTFQKLLWKSMPGALRPIDPKSKESYYDDATWDSLRLSSKNHIDVPVRIGNHVIHVLACHPTPPVFDGPEDRNGCRNHDEIRFWNEYTRNPTAEFLVDDQSRPGGLATDALFFIAGDLNSDPKDGDSRFDAIETLLTNPLLSDPKPSSPGGREAAGGYQSGKRKGDPSLDTAKFGRSGNMRIDYVLPSSRLAVKRAEVFWPTKGTAESKWISASDHRLVWAEVELPSE
ncbi:MAG: endonuclease/exonuclease/phosphatase family protein [Rubripirellula sp.]